MSQQLELKIKKKKKEERKKERKKVWSLNFKVTRLKIWNLICHKDTTNIFGLYTKLQFLEAMDELTRKQIN